MNPTLKNAGLFQSMFESNIEKKHNRWVSNFNRWVLKI